MQDFDVSVKLHIYDTIANTGNAPSVDHVAEALGFTPDEIKRAFEQICSKRLLVLEPGTHKIRMAPPFSAIETPFRVIVNGKSYFANCVWDSLGIPAALHADGNVFTTCGDCGEAMSLQVKNGAPVQTDCAIHFAVPAAHWWDDIIYT